MPTLAGLAAYAAMIPRDENLCVWQQARQRLQTTPAYTAIEERELFLRRGQQSARRTTMNIDVIETGEALLKSILSTVPDAMIVIDDHGCIIWFSRAAEAMFGFSESELLGVNIKTLMPTPDRERHDGYLERYIATGERRIIGIGRITTGRRKNGEQFPMHLSVGEARTEHKRVFTGFIRDLTERREREVQLKELQAELEHVSRVSAIGTMASSLAHELNQPLTAIANYVEAARDLLETPDAATLAVVREALGDAAEQSIRAGQIVRRLRDFIARGDSEKQVGSLRQLIGEANALALTGAHDLGIEVDIELDPLADRVMVDRIQVQQVLLNLVRNAIEAMATSPIKCLRISTKHLPDGMAQVTVGDSGIGIDEDVAMRLFQPFNSSKDTGLGLGLSICRTIIEALGGRIWVETSVDSGTKFHFTLVAATIGDKE